MTSDSDSCACIENGHKTGIDKYPAHPTNGTDATKQCLMGGTDIDSGNTYRNSLAKAVGDGELDIEWAKLGMKNSYKMRMMMGLFDPETPNEYTKIPVSEVGSAASNALSLLAANSGMTLLKKGPLPFAKGTSIAVVGQVRAGPAIDAHGAADADLPLMSRPCPTR